MVRVAPVKYEVCRSSEVEVCQSISSILHSQNHGENESEPRVQFAISRYKFCYHSHARHERNKHWNKLDETIG